MRKLFLTICFLTICSVASATTYYIRPDGGTSAECNGTYDSSAPDFSGNKNCAFNHPFWAISVSNNPTKMQSGDTLIIDGSNNAEYMIGYGAPNLNDTQQCDSSYPWDCYMRAIPSGIDASNPTRILGKGWNTGCQNPPKLWGTQRVQRILNLQGSNNVEIQCLDITDKSECQEFGPVPCIRSTAPTSGPWASTGLYATDSTNVLLKNVNIHGLASKGIHAGRLTDWTIEDSKINTNAFVGWDGDVGANNSSNSGTIAFINTEVMWNGCGDKTDESPHDCFGQSVGGYGDGLGTHNTGANWIFKNVRISNNVSDGLDLLYHYGDGKITIIDSIFENNAGNQIKTRGTVDIKNTYVGGDCSFFNGKSFTYNVDNCRALGNSISLSFNKATDSAILDNITVENAKGDVMILTTESTCSQNPVNVTDSIFKADTEFLSGEKVAYYYGDNCNAVINTSNTYVENTKDGCPAGAICSGNIPSDWGYQGTSTPIPTATPQATATPVITPTPEPTATPVPVPTATPEPCVCPECPICPECPEVPTCEDVTLTPREFYRLSGRDICYESYNNGCICTIIDGDRIFIIKK